MNAELALYNAKTNTINTLAERIETERLKANDMERELKMKKEYIRSDAFQNLGTTLTKKKKRNYDPNETTPEQIQIQIRDLGSEAKKLLNKGRQEIDNENQRQEYLIQLEKSLDTIKGHYKDKTDQEKAINGAQQLLETKTQNKLSENVYDYNLANAERAAEFMKMLSNISPDILIDDNSIERYKKDSDFVNFPWDLSETTRED